MSDQVIQALPDDVVQIATSNQLGSFSRSYQAESAETIVDGPTLTILCVFIFLLFCMLVLQARGALVLSFAASTGAGSVMSIVRAFKARENVVYLFQNGLIYSQNEQLTPLLWSQIASCQIRSEWLYGRLDRCIVRTKEGKRLPIGNIAGYEDLGTCIKSYVG